ncbi:MAG: cell division protein ZipA C-terminal FtsZ-binding domain-containing protein, partial [Gammaproteobacteria bacterium]|nr:cell division protein ZipA C-terminal FtsZ-binding domain-containing protein [Gammaproteobacteria bacterium]
GLDVLDAMLTSGFIHGEMNIFHYFEDEGDKIPVCSVASAVEPGFFEMEIIESIETPGLSLFMQLPGSQEARKSFEIMLSRGRAVAEHLQGDLCDETRSVLTMQTIGHIKERIEAWLFKQKMSRVRAHRH